MSETATTPASAAAEHAPAETTAGTPEFDRQEIQAFGTADGHAVTVIGKMLIGFFFYSLIVMALVGWLTLRGVGQPSHAPADAHHHVDANDF